MRGPYVLQETHFPHSVALKAVAGAREGKVRFGPRSASVCAVYLRNLTFTTSSIWASAAHSFVLS